MKSEILEKISNIVANSDTSESDIDHLMTLIRKLKESEGKNLSSYPMLGLFCDWTKHTVLNRNAEGHRIVIELNDKLRLLIEDEQNKDRVYEEITKVISFERLQNELTSFLVTYQLPADIVEKKELWLRFVIHLLNIVSECPLELPQKRKRLVISSIQNGITATSLNLSWQARSNSKRALFLVIKLSNQKKIGILCEVLGKYIESQVNSKQNTA